MAKKTYDQKAEERFANHIKKQIINGMECWIWTGQKNNDGYGGFLYNHKVIPSHRWAWIYFNNNNEPPPIEKNIIRHLCNVRSCVNPQHLVNGTPQDNVNDMMESCRHVAPSVSKNRNPKLEGKALEIRLKYGSGLREGKHPIHSFTSLAEEYDVERNSIRDLLIGNSYKEAGGPIFLNKKQVGFLEINFDPFDWCI